MTDPARYSAPIVRVYEEIVDTLLTDLAKRFNVKAMGNTNTFAYDVELLTQLGAVCKEAVNTIAARVAENEPMVRLAIEQSMLDALKDVEPSLAEAAREGLLQSAAMPMREGVAAQLEAYSRQAVSQLNLVGDAGRHIASLPQRGISPVDALKKLEAAQGVLNAKTGKVILGASTRQEELKSFAAENELRLSSDRTFVFGYNRSVSQKAVGAARRAERKANYLQNIKPTLPKVAKASDAVLQSTIEVSSGIINGVIPRGVTMERVRVISGYHTSTHLKDVKRLWAEYGGEDYLWDKMTGTVSTDTFIHEIHWYENNGKQYEAKWKGTKWK